MRNNQDRFATAPVPTAGNGAVTSAAFNFIVPTELVTLPSGGKYYPEGHPLRNRETVEIRHMTAREEDILINKTFIDKGVVFDRLIESVLVDKAIKAESILLMDRNAILLAARISAYGSTYDSTATCGKCYGSNDLQVNLDGLLKIRQPEHNENIFLDQSGCVCMILPKTGWKVFVKPLSSGDQDKIELAIEMRKKHNLEENTLLETLRTFIVSINGISDIAVLNEAIMNMPAADSKYLRGNYQKCFPNITSETEITCKICGEESRIEVPFNLNFFWPD